MKRQITFLKKKMAANVIIVLACFIAMPALQSQTVLPNIKVNTVNYNKVSLDGTGKSIVVLDDTVYVVWQGEPTDTTSNIYFSKSIDGGLTFSADLNIFQGSNSIYHVFPSLAVDNSGVIYITWTAVSNNENDYNIWVAKSTNGGISFQAPTQITTTNSFMYSCIGVYNNNVYIFYADGSVYPYVDYYFVYSANNGQSFSTPMQINDVACTGNVYYSDLTTIAIDSAGYIHLAWVDGRRALGHGDIFYAKSSDNGQNFSANVMVNDINQSGADSAQYMPSIAVYDINNVYVSFTDLRLGNDWPSSRVYMAKSINGGSTFSSESFLAGHNGTCKSHNIATSPSGKLSVAICAHIMPNWGVWLFESIDGGNNFSTPVALCDTFTIDYGDIRIILNSNDEAFTIWKDNRNSIENIYFAKTDIGESIIESNIENEYIIYPNPTNNAFSIKMPSSNTKSEISIYNIQGQEIYHKSNNNSISNVNIDIDMPQGIYIVNIKSNNITKSLKLIKK